MKKRYSAWLTGLLAIVTVVGSIVVAPPNRAEAASAKLSLNTGMVTNESGLGEAWRLVDEQSLAGDPRGGTGGATTSNWQPGWNNALLPAYAYIDLGSNYNVTDIYLRDGPGNADVTFYYGSPGSWTSLFTDPLTGYLTWNAHPVSVTTRYIRVGMTTTSTNFSEIVIYGELSGSDTTAPAAISNLAAPTSGSANVNLTWTAPGDDNATGTASSYDIRYSTSTITSGNWASASQATGEPNPAVAGTSQSFNVTGLTANTTYYFAIRASDEVPNVGALSNVVSKATTAATSAKLSLNAGMVTNESGLGDAGMLVDEQSLAGDPRGGTGGATTFNWQPGWNNALLPAYAYIDLGSNYNVTDIYLRDGPGNANVTFYAGSPGSWTSLFTDPLTGYLTWNAHSVSVTTRYIRVGMATTATNFSEIVIYGASSGGGGSDTTAPAAISNLAAPTSGSANVNLTWTAPGDDNVTGTASSYDIRYSTSTITTGNWASASQATGEPNPAVAGTSQSFNVTGLNPSTTYYFAIRASDEASNVANLSNVVSKATTAAMTSSKIVLNASMLLDEGVIASPAPIVDEQTLAGDPRAGLGGVPTTYWNTTWNTVMYPVSVVIDLGTEYALTDMYFYDRTWGGSATTVSTGTPFDWDFQFTETMNNTPEVWIGRSLNVTTRYIQLKADACCMYFNELVLYGTKVGGDPAAPPTPVAHARPTMDQLIGTNMLNDDPLDKAAAVGFVREYHNWIWDDDDKWTYGTINTGYPGYPNNLHRFNGSYGGPDWNFDAYYDTMKDMGITVSPAIMGSPTWLETAFVNKPVAGNEDPMNPLSYAEHASEMFQFMARYGSTTVADGKLKLASDQQRLSGMNLLKYVENWNEQDNWWGTRDAHFKPYEYAAMTSADYDGHMGALSNVHGVKNADPNAKLVMGGIAYLTVDYLKAIKFWSDFNRGGDVPFDVINVHQYSHDGYGQGNGTIGLSPEADNFKGLMKEFVDYRDQYMPGKEVWVTEFGYDIHPGSIGRAPAIGATSAYDVQADWLVRTYLAAAAAGIDKAAQFMLRDEDTTSSARFSTMGLLTDRASGFQPKLSWYAVYTMKETLTGMRYHDEIASGNPNVMIYRFKSATGNNGAYVLWSPTSNNTTVGNYQLTLAGTPTTASKVTMTAGDTNGVTTPLTISGGKVTLNVSERPVYVLVNDID
ncbi:fibronectin type III domain-containing protein [Cohnella sp. GCM10027633]|uniref:fibronectin type III domain-containing protein n=1 Tax=unclassified Cohnella TaxID=2636738 RepID=UPI00362FAD85